MTRIIIVIPVSSYAYRKRALANRGLDHSRTNEVDGNVHMLANGEQTRSPGAETGNGVNQLEICAPRLERITSKL